MDKIESGSALACGHTQVISEHRTKLSKQGLEQPGVWCVTCENWTKVLPEKTEDNV